MHGRQTVLASLQPQGPVARSMAELWWLMFGLGAAVFALVVGLLVVALFRRGTDASSAGAVADTERPSRWILLGGVAMPCVVLLAVLTATVRTMGAIPTRAPDGALVIDVVGHQWWWEVRYPTEGVVTANELHLPVGRPVALRLTSADVIHSFWVPALGGKMDLLPDGTNTLVLQADEPGVHHSRCAEFCGLQHTNHGLLVVAEPQAEFAAWAVAEARPATAATAAADGARTFAEAGCAACHTVRGSAAAGTEGPDLTHVAGRRELGAGVAPNSTAQLTAWITDPHALKEGVEMPPAELDPDQVAAVVAYLESLR